MHHALTPPLAPQQLREARRQLNNHGEVSAELLGPVLARSWQRSAQAGLTPAGRATGTPHASAPQLARALELQRELVAHARPVMEFLHEQTRDTDSIVILANADGMLLQALGDAGFLQRAERVALRPGATWQERWRGTNAIGTALAEGAPLVVHGGEHYLERNGFLTCAAAPIHDPCGRLLGALDLSGDHRSYHRHTLGLVKSAVRMIEHRLFDTRHGHGIRLRLHAQAEGIGTLTESLLALSEDGWVIGANEPALRLLHMAWHDIGASRIGQWLDIAPGALEDLLGRPGNPPVLVRDRRGQTLWMRLEPGLRSVTVAAPSPQASLRTANPPPRPLPSVDALGALDTGDPTLRAALDRARRVLDKPIALLLGGESGVGKEMFARAVHASGPRRDQALVAVNCAALPENLIEAELFGYRPGAFTGASRDGAPGRIREADGGTLFLDEIGDMPLALQGRLLRVLQERQVLPLGGGKPVPVDIQLICATHRNLREAMQAGRFREDLYYRINGLTLQLPALRERQDLPALIERLLRETAPGRALSLSPELAERFAAYRWPGNLRQLANALRTATALMESHEWQIDWAHLPDDLAEDLRQPRATGRHASEDPADLRRLELATTRRVVEECEGNLSEAARRLGISRNTLYRKLREMPAA
ncbi:sigma-54-dependent Fis family transcriptional regulator [Ideonella livida]|uniref:Sigma-54-dependent Fis family transcriptional regulator n=1 Tax=Ideonella livida TaxID=2707176 RepID=A0A7C9PF58_9BURK|nr:sigma-54-dependent Fis family transcriptional regulator [Ideonella livida]NDY89890.1 sigma-54-dependent Fis family transcriptional regulator [Ideonella livida]